jgi:hypothetical protein
LSLRSFVILRLFPLWDPRECDFAFQFQHTGEDGAMS